MNDKLLAAIAGGTPPDVGVCCVQYAELYSRGAVMAIDDQIDNSAVIGRDDFVPGLLESMQWQGETYGRARLRGRPPLRPYVQQGDHRRGRP